MKTKNSASPLTSQGSKRHKPATLDGDDDDVIIECRRTLVDTKQILTQWTDFRRNDSFTGKTCSFAAFWFGIVVRAESTKFRS